MMKSHILILMVILLMILDSSESRGQVFLKAHKGTNEPVAAGIGFSRNRFTFELTGSHKKVISTGRSGIGYSDLNGNWKELYYNDRWKETVTCLTGKVLVDFKKRRPKVSFYYGAYFRYIDERYKMTHSDWTQAETDYAAANPVTFSNHYRNAIIGGVAGAHGNLFSQVYWDFAFGVSLVPAYYNSSKTVYSLGVINTSGVYGGFPIFGNLSNFVQLGILVKIVPPEKKGP